MREAVRVLVLRVVSMVLSLAAILLVYAFVPVDLTSAFWVQAAVVLLAAAFVGVSFARQVRHIRRSAYPVLQAVQGLVVVLATLLAVTSLAAYAIALDDQGAFSEPLTRLDAFYFSVTTLATVGYGDITPVSDGARVFGIIQMLVNLAFIGVVIRVISAVASSEMKARRQA
jgi:voltage-gated potassium channel